MIQGCKCDASHVERGRERGSVSLSTCVNQETDDRATLDSLRGLPPSPFFYEHCESFPSSSEFPNSKGKNPMSKLGPSPVLPVY